MRGKDKKIAVSVISICLPLISGLFIYLTSGGGNYLTDCISLTGLVFPRITYPGLVRNYACDFLWSYSLFSAVELAISEGKPKIRAAVAVSFVTMILLETLQQIPQFPGTFDVWDIAVETAAIAIAAVVTITLNRRFKYEEKVN